MEEYLKKSNVYVNGRDYERWAIKTHFVEPCENFIELTQKYVSRFYEEKDILFISEKIVALCQNRIVRREDIKISLVAKILSRFASHPSHGIGVGETIKMQFAIDTVGLPKVLYASAASAVTKLFGKKGVFYEIVGPEVSGLDGFYDKVWAEYRDIGILIPEKPDKVCDRLYDELKIKAVIVDANDLGQVILGKYQGLSLSEEDLLSFVKDNPAGQGKECTPFILMKRK